MSFESFQLASSILRAVAEEGYDTPTPIQAQAIAPVMAGRDLLGLAQTGTGKTAAFALPIIHRLMAEMPERAEQPRRVNRGRGRRRGRGRDQTASGPKLPPRCLILAPTRELATQIADSFAAYGRHTPLRHVVIFGGVSQSRQVTALQQGVDIIVATPGRLLDLMEQGYVDLTGISIFVLDEADRMLDMGFIKPIRQVAASLPTKRQTLLFSATMPREIVHLADSLLTDPVKVEVISDLEADPDIAQSIYMVQRQAKQALLQHLLTSETDGRTLVFTRTKHGADRVRKHLGRAGIDADAIHGNKSQNQRERALGAFRDGRIRVLVATDVAARGIDVDGITHVINFDMPVEPEAYVHRIGRTARAGASGAAISFCDGEERDLLRAIERLIDEPIAVTPLPDLPHIPAPPARTHDGTANGRGRNGHPRNGAARNGTARNGAPRNSAPRNGTPRNGPARNGDGQSRGGNRSSDRRGNVLWHGPGSDDGGRSRGRRGSGGRRRSRAGGR